MTESLILNAECHVSSVLNRNTKEVGKKYLFDGDSSSCWNSDQGSCQWIRLKWNSEQSVKTIIGNFQGGFSGGQDTAIQTFQNDSWVSIATWYVEDRGGDQVMELPGDGIKCSAIRILFNSSTDFFGRIIMYKLDILGDKS